VRTAAVLKLGYYPLAPAEAVRIRRYLRFPDAPASVLDPCAGTGAALAALTADTRVRRYGIELDSFRAGEARSVLEEVIQGDAMNARAPVESFSLLYLNPPYQHEIGEGRNERFQRIFLNEFARWVRPGGVLVFVLPFDRVTDCRQALTLQFRDKAVYRLSEPEAEAYKQVVVFGVRRARAERERMTDAAVSQGQRILADLTRRYDQIPGLPNAPDRTYTVPPSEAVKIEYRGLPLDQIEDLIEQSPAWRQARRITHAPIQKLVGRPLTPLHPGHLSLLTVSGCLNGCLGEGVDRHLSFWESVKVVDRIEEEGDAGEAVIREKQRFSQRLTLLFATGKYLLISEKALL
jgi:SAM-dependent methyltransferase